MNADFSELVRHLADIEHDRDRSGTRFYVKIENLPKNMALRSRRTSHTIAQCDLLDLAAGKETQSNKTSEGVA